MKRTGIICFAIVVLLFVSGTGKTSGSDNFSFIAMGDMPYFLPEDYTRFENVIKEVNKHDQAFNVFVGDIKSSRTKCSEDAYRKIYNSSIQSTTCIHAGG